MKNFRKILSLLLTVLIIMPFVTSCGLDDASIGIIGGADGPTSIIVSGFGEETSDDDAEIIYEPETEALPLDVNGTYDSRDDVALYLHIYGELPQNYITKVEAKKLGWEGGSVEKYAPGKCIGGSSFGNYEGILPQDATYYECDINTLGKDSRGAERLVYTEDGYIYYTGDHYESFELLYEGGEEQ